MQPTAATNAAVLNDVLFACGNNAVYILGLGMIVGSLFTILVLLLLDFSRRNKDNKPQS